MKRKTNLFNLDDENSLFLTFSNYTEHLTGNFLSTNTKLYPSSFLCFNLPFNEEKSIIGFKKYLMQYYENKLTALRTYYVGNDEKTEENVTPLLYLLDTIYNYFKNDESVKIQYIGDIVEQDYNGTYSDSICIINLNSGYEINQEHNSFSGINVYVKKETSGDNINEEDTNNSTTEENSDNTITNVPTTYTYDDTVLFGWKLNEISSLYDENIEPVYDDEDENGVFYYSGSTFSLSNLISREKNSNDEEITFNCIVPLFDIKNIKEVILSDDFDTFRNNIPFGIWISPNNISVSKKSGFAQSWSLVIGSKFSPFPYSAMNTIDDNNSFDETTIKNIAYMTYAELLAKHSELQNKYYECLQLNSRLTDELTEIKASLNSLLIQTNYDKISELVDNKISDLEDKFNAKMKTIEEYIANLKWKYIN